jgi:hypothetical protein
MQTRKDFCPICMRLEEIFYDPLASWKNAFVAAGCGVTLEGVLAPTLQDNYKGDRRAGIPLQ